MITLSGFYGRLVVKIGCTSLSENSEIDWALVTINKPECLCADIHASNCPLKRSCRVWKKISYTVYNTYDFFKLKKMFCHYWSAAKPMKPHHVETNAVIFGISTELKPSFNLLSRFFVQKVINKIIVSQFCVFEIYIFSTNELC
jgi:hypothetical protein